MNASLLSNLKCRPQLLQLRSNTLQSLLSVRVRPKTVPPICCSSVAADGQEVAAGLEVSTPAPQDTLWQNNTERYQPVLSKVEKNEKRADSQRLGKKLVTLIIGRAGITRNTVYALGDALSANELVKVRLYVSFPPSSRSVQGSSLPAVLRRAMVSVPRTCLLPCTFC